MVNCSSLRSFRRIQLQVPKHRLLTSRCALLCGVPHFSRMLVPPLLCLWMLMMVPMVNGQKAWQAGVLCLPSGNSTSSNSTGACSSRTAHNAALVQQWQQSLKSSVSGGWNITTTKSGTFLVLSRYLKPTEANIQFAQAFCLSKGGQLAYWNTQQEYEELSALIKNLAQSSKSQWHVYVGVAQIPGSKEPSDGWIWVHNSSAPGAAFPWATGEPNQHNGATQPGHLEDCAVVATYHGQKAIKLVDDFPCNYADSKGKYLFNGWNPKLSVACRTRV